MAYTQADLDKLKAIRLTGAKRIRYADGVEVEYVPGPELDKVIDQVAESLQATASPRVIRTLGGKGV